MFTVFGNVYTWDTQNGYVLEQQRWKSLSLCTTPQDKTTKDDI